MKKKCMSTKMQQLKKPKTTKYITHTLDYASHIERQGMHWILKT